MEKPGFICTVAEARARLPQTSSPLRFVELFDLGPVLVEFYAPQGEDVQTPHDKDEIYVIATGSGVFLNGELQQPFNTGDVLFVPAHQPHRFIEFTADFQAWVLFF